MTIDHVAVRNLRKGPTVLDNPEDSRKYYQWGGANSPDGSDILRIPSSLTTTNQFLAARNVGIFEIVPDEVAQTDYARRTEARISEEEAKRKTVKDSIDTSAARTIEADTCIGPDARGSGVCGQRVVVNPDLPPLCTKHKSLQSQYVQEENWDNKNKVVTWHRVSLDRAVRQTQ